MCVPSIGPVTALAFIAAIEDPKRFKRTRDTGAYLGLTGKRYQPGETDIALGISKQGDGMARHYLYEAANVLLTGVKNGGQETLCASKLGVEALKDARPQKGPRRGGKKARGPAWPHLERWNTL